MKQIILSFFLIASFAANAQLAEKTTQSVRVAPVPCAGISNTDAGDVNWSALLINKSPQILNAANQQLIDSIKEAKRIIKEATAILRGNTARTTSVHPVLGTNFAANTMASPSNNSIAISDSGYIVSVNNSRISFYKDNGTLLYSNNITAWMPFGTSINVSNPMVIYDTKAAKFIFICQQTPITDTGKIYICFSRSFNPAATTGWYCYSLRGNPAGGGEGFDFPRIAVNDSELFVTGNLYSGLTSTPYFSKPIIHQIDKLAGYAGASMSSIYYPYVIGGAFGILPVSEGQSAGITTGMYLVSTGNSGGSSISLYKITGNLFSMPTMTYNTVSTTTYSPPSNARQMGSSTLLNVGDCRILSGFLLGNKIHFVFNADAGSGVSGINYNRLNITTMTNVSSMFSGSGTDYAYPSVVSYATTATDPSVIIGFQASSSSIYPEVRVVNCDSAMTWSATTLVRPGTSFVNATGSASAASWGDYTGTARRHNSPAPSVWMNAGYGNASHAYDTWVAEIHDAITTPCPAATGLYVTGITTSAAILHWVAVGGALNYNIQYRPYGSSTWTPTSSTTTSKSITGLTNSTLYEYQVQAMCSDSSLSSFSATVDTFRTKKPPVFVNDLNGYNNARIYPNPAGDQFAVAFNLNNRANVSIVVTDIAGKAVKELYNGAVEAGENDFSFSTANLPDGVYILRIASEDQLIKNEKIVISR